MLPLTLEHRPALTLDQHLDLECGIDLTLPIPRTVHDLTITQVHSRIGFMCKIKYCTETFVEEEARNQHMRTLHNVFTPPFECFECDTIFIEHADLWLHWKNYHMSRPFPYKCKTCWGRTSTWDNLYHHKIRLHGNGPALPECQHCKEMFETTPLLRAHLKEAHQTDSQRISRKRMYPCLLCDKVYASSYNMRRHRSNAHEDAGSFFCEYCHATFANKMEQAVHMIKMVHTKVACNLCASANIFDDGEKLKTHIFMKHTRLVGGIEAEGLNPF